MARKTVAILLFFLFLGALGCPTTRNPALPDDLDADEDLEPREDGAIPDADTPTCRTGLQYCNGQCVSLDDDEHCGDCETQCNLTIMACRCIQREGDRDFACWRSSGSSWTSCELE